ncbi:MAG: tRNA uridine-5-carboxymethylaminomethyl(34) synthesis GTPase MnmE [Rikenellaceae bacterium]
MNNNDTIVALSTGRGGAIALIRVTGNEAINIVDNFFQPTSKKGLTKKNGFTLNYGNFIDRDGNKIDDVLISLFRNPKTYTGEDMVEISCHASDYIIGEIISTILGGGARIAEPGEFTQRAYLNGKMDIVQAEAVADMIASTSKSSHTLAMNQMRGGYSLEFSVLRDKLLHLMSLLELELDFSEEDVEFADRSLLNRLLNEIYTKIDILVGSFKLGNAIKNGIPVAIVGSPNVGKSTLLNAFLKEDRAIVSSIAGTTRDVIEETITFNGVLFRFIDTAGIRETEDIIESIGVERAISTIAKAEIVMFVVDAEAEISDTIDNFKKLHDQDAFSDKNLFLLINKCDLADTSRISQIKSAFNEIYTDYVPFELSAKSGLGVSELETYLSKEYNIGFDTESVVISNLRHHDLLSSAKTSTQRAILALENNLPNDLISGDIRETIHHLGSLTGDISTDDILGNIFMNFCIGK